jgi:uncharacterized membrane protein YeaQ/YmgE (transglycosylase-associated protein family)
MSKWWSWIPGMHSAALNSCRREALSSITGERLFVERMAQRPRAGDPLNTDLLAEVLKKLGEIYAAAEITTDTDELDDFMDDADLQGLFAAYLCPASEIKIEGDVVLDQIHGWGIPQASTETARALWGEASKKNPPSVSEMRGALYALFQERDAWGDFLEDHEEEQHGTKRILFGAVFASLLAAVFGAYFGYFFLPFLMLGLLAAGAAGSCASVFLKMPTLEEYLSRKPNGYGAGVLARIATGLIGAVVGSALLAWVPLSIENKSFGEVVSACAAANSRTAVMMLIFIGIPTALGFSERTLPFFEQRLFGKAAGVPRARSARRKVL